MSLDPSDHAAAAAKLQREQQQREHETSDGSSAAADDEGEFGPEQESKFNEEGQQATQDRESRTAVLITIALHTCSHSRDIILFSIATAELLHTKTPLLTGDDVNEKREEIREVGGFTHSAQCSTAPASLSLMSRQSVAHSPITPSVLCVVTLLLSHCSTSTRRSRCTNLCSMFSRVSPLTICSLRSFVIL